jgi:hypothetical protein
MGGAGEEVALWGGGQGRVVSRGTDSGGIWWELNFSWTPADRERGGGEGGGEERERERETRRQTPRVCESVLFIGASVCMCGYVFACGTHTHTHTHHTHIQTRAGCERKRGAARISTDLVYLGYPSSIETHKTRTHLCTYKNLIKKTYGVREKEG